MPYRLSLDPAKMAREWAGFNQRLADGMQVLREITEEDVAIALTPKEEVHRDNKMRLYRYTPKVKKPLRTPVLLVYALVGRYNVADLQPGRSLIEKLLELGLDVYAIDWGHPSRGDRWLTLGDYVNRYIDDCVSLILERSGLPQVNLAGICQGGVFTLCYAALHPDRIKNLVLTVTPVDFHGDAIRNDPWRGFVNVWMRATRPEDIDLLIDTLGNIPGSMMGMAFAMMSPVGALTKYTSDLVPLFGDKEALLSFLKMERWLDDQPDHPGEACRQWLQDLYQKNAMVKNELMLGPHRVDLRNIKSPILNIYAEQDHVVPPECSQALRRCIDARTEYKEVAMPGGHIGIFVGGKSQKLLAPAISQWLGDHEK